MRFVWPLIDSSKFLVFPPAATKLHSYLLIIPSNYREGSSEWGENKQVHLPPAQRGGRGEKGIRPRAKFRPEPPLLHLDPLGGEVLGGEGGDARGPFFGRFPVVVSRLFSGGSLDQLAAPPFPLAGVTLGCFFIGKKAD